jgi:hypothetical protein
VAVDNTRKEDLTVEWQLRQTGIDYNAKLDYYNVNSRNIDFYKGEQWKGVQAGGLPTPVFNIFKRIINFQIASIMSQKVTGKYTVDNIPTEPTDPMELDVKELADKMSAQAEQKWEKLKMDTMLREALLDGALSGDYCAYTYWDSNYQTGQEAQGDFVTELVDGGNVFFGNPNTHVVDKEPYILIGGRALVSDLRKEAVANGVSKEEAENITADEDNEYESGSYGKIELDNATKVSGKATYIIKFWREDGYIWFNKAVKHCVIRKSINMGIKKYPIAWGNWEKVKNTYHGQAVGTGLIPNQIYINKQFAMVMLWMMYNAMGKTLFDSTRIASWSNQIGVAIPVQGDLNGAVQQLQPGQMNNVVMQVIDKTIQYTKDMLGANDSALGDINPEQASGAAITAVQKQASVPLELVQANLYQFVEDIYCIWGEFMLRKYTADRKIMRKDGDNNVTDSINTANYQDILLSVKVDVGASSYWSEIASMQTLDNMLNAGHIDIIQYLERMPQGNIPKKQELIDELRQRMEQKAMMEQQQAAIPQEQAQPEQDNTQLFEAMAVFMESLPPDIQQQLQALPPDEMESQLLDMMNGGN